MMPKQKAAHLKSTVIDRLPETFAFSQSSLQAYENCPRRFWLAYVEQLPWPAVQASPVSEYEKHMRQGSIFHRLVERVESGMDPNLVGAGLTPPLSDWFDAYLRFRPADLPTDVVEIEKVLSIPFSVDDDERSPTPAYRLAAKYDLIAAEADGAVVIMDWKTTRRRADPAILRRRLQSIVYPYVLVEASRSLPWGPVRPEQVEMRYWFTATPGQPLVFRYDGAQHAANHGRLQALLASILAGADEADYPKVPDSELNRRRFCNYCIYRSRCNRGDVAGDLDELDDPEDFFAVDASEALEFTLDDVVEIEF
jgi:hypothetical protein